MKAEIINETSFKPFSIKVTFDTYAEAKLLDTLLKMNVRIPEYMIKENEIVEEHEDDLIHVMNTIRDEVSKGLTNQ